MQFRQHGGGGEGADRDTGAARRAGRRIKIHELITPRAGSSFALGRWRGAAFPYQWHVHPEAELTLILAGDGRRHIGDSVEPFSAGEVVLVGPGTPHTWHTEPAPGVQVHSLVAQFPADALADAARALPELASLERLMLAARRGLVAEGAVRRAITADMEAMIEAAEPLERLALLLRALARLGDGSSCRPLASVAYEPPEAGRDESLTRLKRYLHEHRHEPLPQSRVARLAGVSTAAFSRFFKANFNRGYRAYLAEMRVADACRLLADSDRPVMDIALSCGFANLANFNRRFKQVKGTTPSAFRRAARGE
jgi:AraC-like DNA-binding protein/quercetin dioxygenase-like cupin family protein